MANQTTKQTKNTQENIKNVETTLVALKKVQKTLGDLRQKISSIQVEINLREAYLNAPVVVETPVAPAVEKVAETKPAVPVVEQKVEPKVEKPVESTKGFE